MKYYSHNVITSDCTVFTFLTNGCNRWLFSTTPWGKVSKQAVFEFCEKIGADFDCFYDENGDSLKAEEISKAHYATCLKDLSQADDIFDGLDDGDWWSVTECGRPTEVEFCVHPFRG